MNIMDLSSPLTPLPKGEGNLSANLAHAALRAGGHGDKHVVMFGFLGNGLREEWFERLSISHRVAQGNFGGNDQTGAQASIGS